jgi:hypothetical protein
MKIIWVSASCLDFYFWSGIGPAEADVPAAERRRTREEGGYMRTATHPRAKARWDGSEMRKLLIGGVTAAAAITFAAPAHANGSQASLTDAVRQVYNKVQTRCTPNMPPSFQSITTDGQGNGHIIDANPRLGGEFNYMWGPNGSPGVPGAQYYRVDADDGNGIWFIALEFC